MDLLLHSTKDGTYTYYMENGEEVKHGFCEAFQRAGRRWIETTYKHGKMHGHRKIWNSYGRLWKEECFKDDKLFGLQKIWYQEGGE